MDVKNLVPWRRAPWALAHPGSFENASPVFGLHRNVNRLFDDFFRDFDRPLMRGFASDWPAIEVADEEKAFRIVAELPGLEEKDIDLSLRVGVLTIKGEKARKDDGSIYSERWHGQFTRAIDLGPDIDPDKIKAFFEKGVLTETVEKRSNPKTETKRISINHG